MICALCKKECDKMFLCMPCCDECKDKLEGRQERRMYEIKKIAKDAVDKKKWRTNG